MQVDLLPEIALPPTFLPQPGDLFPASWRAELDSYLATRQPQSLLSSLRQRLMLSQQEAVMIGTRYNVPLLNGLVFYVGIKVRSRAWVGVVADCACRSSSFVDILRSSDVALCSDWKLYS